MSAPYRPEDAEFMDVCPNCTGSGDQLDVDFEGPGFRREPCTLCGGDGLRDQEPRAFSSIGETQQEATIAMQYARRYGVVVDEERVAAAVTRAYIDTGVITPVEARAGMGLVITRDPPLAQISFTDASPRIYTSPEDVARDFGTDSAEYRAIVANMFRSDPPSPELAQMYEEVQEVVDNGGNVAPNLVQWAAARAAAGDRTPVGVVENVPVNTPLVTVRVDVPDGVPTSGGVLIRGTMWMQAGEELRVGDAVSVDGQGRAVRVRRDTWADSTPDDIRSDINAMARRLLLPPVDAAQGADLDRVARTLGVERREITVLNGDIVDDVAMRLALDLRMRPETDDELRARVLAALAPRSREDRVPWRLATLTPPIEAINCRCVLAPAASARNCTEHGPRRSDRELAAHADALRTLAAREARQLADLHGTRHRDARRVEARFKVDNITDPLTLTLTWRVIAGLERVVVYDDNGRERVYKDRGAARYVLANSRDRRRWRALFRQHVAIAEDALREDDRAGAIAALADLVLLDVAIRLTTPPRWYDTEQHPIRGNHVSISGRANFSAPPQQLPRETRQAAKAANFGVPYFGVPYGMSARISTVDDPIFVDRTPSVARRAVAKRENDRRRLPTEHPLCYLRRWARAR